ncbi:YciI family protein [Altererythrobacter aquiaggeris]|uniref:YciI family protein n=1 Tax=Aestuarierythrobacter aquiaggeris TaxID=1898396 RepID=UPI0030197EC6
MKLFAFHCRDGEHSPKLREDFLQRHLDHVEANIERYVVAGPLKDGDKMVGLLLVIRAEDIAEARIFFETDPYFDAGVWQAIRVSEFLAVAGEWVGVVSWKG